MINNQDHAFFPTWPYWKKFVKRQQSISVRCNFTKKFEFNIFLKAFFPIASYGARVRGSVFKIRFRVLSKDFESIETSHGFAQLMEENWN